MQLPQNLLAEIFGPFDTYLKKIENLCCVQVIVRGDDLKFMGEEKNIAQAITVFERLAELVQNTGYVDIQQVEYILDAVRKKKSESLADLNKEILTLTYAGKPIKAKTLGQLNYVHTMKKNMVVFGIGPAGTGKTYLAMAMAVQAFRKNEVNKIILTRPAIEAGEKLGFLPGDLQSKVDPYLRPLYDALFEIMGPEAFEKNMEKGLIEVAPLAYMRGRTLNHAYIVLDEAQNTTPQQMKMFLTRLGFQSRAVITGDLTQVDLPHDKPSGLHEAMKVLKDVEGVSFSYLNRDDVVRHPVVQRIVDAYEAFDNIQKKNKK